MHLLLFFINGPERYHSSSYEECVHGEIFPALEEGSFHLVAGAVLLVSASFSAQEGHAVVCSGKKQCSH